MRWKIKVNLQIIIFRLNLNFVSETLQYIAFKENRQLKYLKIDGLFIELNDCVFNTIKSAPYLRELNLSVNTVGIVKDEKFKEFKQVLSELKFLNKLRLGFSFQFGCEEVLNDFVESFKTMLVEFVVDVSLPIVSTDYYYTSLSKLTKVRKITVTRPLIWFKSDNFNDNKDWISKLAQSFPNLFYLTLVNIEEQKPNIHQILKFWPNIKYVSITLALDFKKYKYHQQLKDLLHSIKKQNIFTSPIMTLHFSELLYSKVDKTIITNRSDLLYGKLPSTIEHLYFNSREQNYSDYTEHINKMFEILTRSPQLRTLRTIEPDVYRLFNIFQSRAIKEPNKTFQLVSHINDWLYQWKNFSSNCEKMRSFYEYGPQNKL